MARLVRRTIGLGSAAAMATAVATVGGGGCNSGPASTQPATVEQRQDSALRDPMSYKQQVGNGDGNTDITHLDSGGLKRDLNDVFGP